VSSREIPQFTRQKSSTNYMLGKRSVDLGKLQKKWGLSGVVDSVSNVASDAIDSADDLKDKAIEQAANSAAAKTVTDKVADVTDTVNNEASNLDLEDAFEVADELGLPTDLDTVIGVAGDLGIPVTQQGVIDLAQEMQIEEMMAQMPVEDLIAMGQDLAGQAVGGGGGYLFKTTICSRI
ncbi:uncharacterized protein LOC142356579, partial [Convolutriloba macropyga]|uniref:uncharacterized protein LOC142356579 n=1 Tax=Convolutriloba macropyga TaxID=536237 RepID=UPI003F526230